MCILLEDIATVNFYSVFTMFIVFLSMINSGVTLFGSEWRPYTFINVLTSNNTIELVNTDTSMCHSTIDIEPV